MPYTAEQEQQIEDWVQRTFPDGMQCSMCHAPDPGLVSQAAIVRLVDPETAVVRPKSNDQPWKLIALQCNRCGHLMLLNPEVMGVDLGDRLALSG